MVLVLPRGSPSAAPPTHILAAQLIGDLIAGASSPLLDDFALDRDGGMAGH
jgi:hypothetical protein